jgi:hypothetical protein
LIADCEIRINISPPSLTPTKELFPGFILLTYERLDCPQHDSAVLGPRVTARLLEHFGSAEAVFDAPRRELALLRLTPETIESIAIAELHERAEEDD